MHLVERVVDSMSGLRESSLQKMKAKLSCIKQIQISQADEGIRYSSKREQDGQ